MECAKCRLAYAAIALSTAIGGAAILIPDVGVILGIVAAAVLVAATIGLTEWIMR